MTDLSGLKIFTLLAGLSLLAACQVQPLYSTKPIENGGSSFTASLAAVEISEPKSRIEQLVRNELQFSLSGSNEKSGSLPYILELNTSKSVRSVGISDVDFGPAAFFITISTDYVLKDLRQAAPIAQGTQRGTAGYDRVDQEFANLRSEKDAEERAAKVSAQKIKQALALALHAQQQN